MPNKKCVAMLLAGGQGTRLGELTKGVAKPAVPFGGKYRIIDFALSNCTHSGIDTVGVLTQYQPHLLNAYVGNGKAWDLDRNVGGVSVLPPFLDSEGGHWYKGTANAVYQNINFINQYDPEYVVILSGDHIYKMDYQALLHFHIEKKADATIAVIKVQLEEAPRFGIMNTNENKQIVEFEEKPTFPKSNLASMGVYLFNWKSLRQHLMADNKDPKSSNDFGKDIIPKLLNENNRLFAYPFTGYWKDVGTIQSLWEAHMDLLNNQTLLDLDDPDWKIYSGHANQPPTFLSSDSKVHQSIINEGSIINGHVIRSVISYNVYIGKGAKIIDSVVLPGVTVGDNVTIKRAIVSGNIKIEEGSVIGSDNPEEPIKLIYDQKNVNTTIQSII